MLRVTSQDVRMDKPCGFIKISHYYFVNFYMALKSLENVEMGLDHTITRIYPGLLLLYKTIDVAVTDQHL